MFVPELVEALKQTPGDGAVLADQLPSLLTLARGYYRGGDVVEVDDLLMAGVRGVLEALRTNPSAPGAYLHGAGRRAMLVEAQRMLWHGKWKTRAERQRLSMDESHEPTGGDERVEASAQLALIKRKARPFDWKAGLETWLLEHTLREASQTLGRSASVLCESRARLCA